MTDSDVPTVPAEVPTEPPKISCDVTIVVRDGQIQALRVTPGDGLTYNQLKEICLGGAQRVDVEFTERCKDLKAMMYQPALG